MLVKHSKKHSKKAGSRKGSRKGSKKSRKGSKKSSKRRSMGSLGSLGVGMPARVNTMGAGSILTGGYAFIRGN